MGERWREREREVMILVDFNAGTGREGEGWKGGSRRWWKRGKEIREMKK